MGRCFGDAVETALQYVFYGTKTRAVRGQEGLKLLQAASEDGDGDADCILALCLSGIQYVWSGHHFPEDTERVRFLVRRSVMRGSAIGVLMAQRNGNLQGSLVWQSPLSLQDAFRIVQGKAMSGEPCCQGLGIPEDIAKGVDFLKREEGEIPKAAAELKKCRKTLFGRWTHR